MARRISVEIVGDATSLERAFAKAKAAGAGFSGGFARLDKVEPQMRTIGRGLSKYVTLPVIAAGVASVAMGAKYEDTMQKIVGLSGVSQRQVNKFRNEVLKLAPAVGKSPQELAEALYFITSSGIPASKAMGALTVSAKASAAGLGETQVVANAISSAMNAYGMSNMTAAHATDVLVATVREGKGEASDFAGSIGNVAGFAAQLGVSFEDVGAALASMTKLGTDAETSSIQLMQIFSSIVKVSPAAEKAFKSVGLSSAGLKKELREKGLLATLKTLREHFKGNTTAISMAFRDMRAFRGVIALVGKQAESVEQVFKRMGNSKGSLKVAFGAVSKDTLNQFNRMKASIQATMIVLGAALAPVALRVARIVKAIVDGFARLPHFAKVGLGTIIGLLAVGGPMILGFAAVIRALRTIRTLWTGIGPAAERAAAQTVLAETAIGTGAEGAATKVYGLRAALLSLPGALAIGAAAFGAYALYQSVKTKTYPGAQKTKGDDSNATSAGAYVYSRDGKYYKAFPGSRFGRGQEITKSQYEASLGQMPDVTKYSNITGGSGMHGALLTNRHTAPASTTATVHTATGTKQLSLAGRFNLQEFALANAGLTAGQGDDRRILNTEAAITREQIKHAKTLKDKVSLTQRLADILSRIRGIDQDAAQKEKARLQAIKEARSHFDVPLALQLAEAKAGAAASTGKHEGLTDAQVSVQRRIRAAAMKALQSGRLAIEGQIDAWNTIAQANQQLADQAKHGRSTYHKIGAHALTSGLDLSRAQRVALEQRISQSQAHRGQVPDGRAANGVVIHEAHFHGVQNPKQLADALDRYHRQGSAQRRGRSAGVN